MNFTDLLPLGDEEDQHDEDFLKHHDENVEDTLTQPCCALHRLSYTHTHTRKVRQITVKKPAWVFRNVAQIAIRFHCFRVTQTVLGTKEGTGNVRNDIAALQY